jgi:hypothetical protein
MLAAFVAIVSLILIGAFLILIPLAVLLIAAALGSGPIKIPLSSNL